MMSGWSEVIGEVQSSEARNASKAFSVVLEQNFFLVGVCIERSTPLGGLWYTVAMMRWRNDGDE